MASAQGTVTRPSSGLLRERAPSTVGFPKRNRALRVEGLELHRADERALQVRLDHQRGRIIVSRSGSAIDRVGERQLAPRAPQAVDQLGGSEPAICSALSKLRS